VSTLPFGASGTHQVSAPYLSRVLPVAAAVLAHAFVAAWLWQSRGPAVPVSPPVPKVVELVELPAPLPAAAAPVHAQAEPPKPPVNHAPPPRAVTPPVHQRPAQQPARTVEPAKAQPAADAPATATPTTPATSNTSNAAVAHADTHTGNAAPAAADEPVTAPIGNADYLHNPAPDYPRVAEAHEWQGRVLLHVHVLASGRPDRVELQTSSGHSVLDDAAIAAVRNWLFVPAKRGATAIDGWVSVPVNFNLSN
jgi:periplasmic protein TonB